MFSQYGSPEISLLIVEGKLMDVKAIKGEMGNRSSLVTSSEAR